MAKFAPIITMHVCPSLVISIVKLKELHLFLCDKNAVNICWEISDLSLNI